MTHPDDTKLAEEAAREIFNDPHLLPATAILRALRKQRAEFEAADRESRVNWMRRVEEANASRDAAVRETAKRCAEICREYAAVQNKAFTQPTQAINVCANKIEAEFARAPSAPVESGKVL